jgi:hypothetical protein
VSEMQDAECKMQNGWRCRALVVFLHFAFCILHSSAARADELSVDRTTLNTDDTLTIVVSLEGPFAGVDSVNVPLQNLKLVAAPSTSSQIAWINGVFTQRKVFRFLARPEGAGAALVGPLTIEGEGGRRETLAPVAVQVLPDVTAGTNDPLQILHELLSTRRDPFLVVAQADRTSVYAGEELVVTWTLYNAATVQAWDIGEIPKLEDFWTEELDVRNEQPQQVQVGPYTVQKLAIRRVALFPLRAGTLAVGPLELRGSIMKRTETNPFGIFEGSVIDVTRHSAPIAIEVRPLPPGPPVDAVGEVAMNCGRPRQANGGPVAIDVALSGRANLRAATPPRWGGSLDGSVQVEEGKLTVTRTTESASMTRRWKLLVFPAHAGTFTLPPLVATIFSPVSGRHQLRCAAVTLNVTQSDPQPAFGTPLPASRGAGLSWQRSAIAIAAIAILGVITLFALPKLRRTRAIASQARVIASSPNIHEAILHLLEQKGLDERSLLREDTDRGDTYRSLHSLLQRGETEDEIEFRLRDFLQFLQ